MQSSDQAAPRRAIAYYRTSAHPPEAIESQRAIVREWAAKNGIEIVEELEDSSTDDEDRPAFCQLMSLVAQRFDLQYVVCTDATRLGRSTDARPNLLQFGKELTEALGLTEGELSPGLVQAVDCYRQSTRGKPEMPMEDDALYPVYVQFARFRDLLQSLELEGGAE